MLYQFHKRSHEGLLLFALLAMAFMIRLVPLQVSHQWDETSYLQNAEVIFSGRTNYDEFFVRPPFLSILFVMGFVVYHHIFTASVIVALLGTLGVAAIYAIGKEMDDRKVGFLAALFLAFSPFLSRSSHALMTGVPALTFMSLSFLFLKKAEKNRKPFWFFLCGLFFGMAILTRFTSLFLIVVLVAEALFSRIKLKETKHFIYGILITIIPYLVWNYFKFGSPLSTIIRALVTINYLDGGTFYYLYNFTVVFPFLFTGLLILKVFQIIKKQKIDFSDIVLFLWILLFIINITMIPHKEPRYLIPIAVPVFLLSARFTNNIFQSSKGVMKSLAIFAFLLLFVPQIIRAMQPLKLNLVSMKLSDEVAASQFLISINQNNYTIYASTNYPVFAYYTGFKTVGFSDDELCCPEKFPERLGGQGYLIKYKKLNKNPPQKWLNNLSNVKLIKDFLNFSIFELKGNYTKG